MSAGYSFHPRLWPWLAAALACAAGIALGQWQSRRALEKLALARQFDAMLEAPAIELSPASGKDVVGRRVAARGVLDAAHAVFLDNKIRQGRVGYEVVVPLALGGHASVLVNLGWIAAGPTREALPDPRLPAGEVRVDGLALERLPHALESGAPSAGKVRQNLDAGAYAAETGLALLPFVIQARHGPGDALARDWPRPDVGADRNQAYALQWYSLAALAVVLAAVFSFKRDQPS
jgi:surfeit locus 1 family protein